MLVWESTKYALELENMCNVHIAPIKCTVEMIAGRYGR